MNCQVHWTVFLQAKSARKVDRLLDRFASAIGHKIAMGECERYWKEPTLFRAVVICHVPADDLSSAIGAVLQLCWQLAGSWTLGTPQIYEGERWEFSGSAVGPSIAMVGLKDIYFQACNWKQSPTEPVAQTVVQNEAGSTGP